MMKSATVLFASVASASFFALCGPLCPLCPSSAGTAQAGEPLDSLCSLDEEARAKRVAHIAEVLDKALISGPDRLDDGRVKLVLNADYQEEIAALVDAESHCCVSMTIETQQEGDTLTLLVDAPEPLLEVIEGLGS